MPFQKGDPKRGGRQKGTPNKTSAAVKEAVQLAFDGLGGVPALVRWAKKNPSLFYTKLAIKLIPSNVAIETANEVEPLKIEVMHRK